MSTLDVYMYVYVHITLASDGTHWASLTRITMYKKCTYCTS